MFPCVVGPEYMTAVELGTRGDSLESLNCGLEDIPPGIGLGLFVIAEPWPRSLGLGAP